MNKPNIEEAKRIAKKYGMDRPQCRRYGKFADLIYEKIMKMEIVL